MGQGQEHKTRAQLQVEIQERGEIFFFYRPKVNKEEAHGIDDVQRLYIVLRPESGEKPVEEKQEPGSSKNGTPVGTQEVNIGKETLFRFIVMGKKMLPDTTKKSQPYWGLVEMVTTKIQDVKDALAGEEYDTKTRGHRHKPPARAVGEGVYRILRHIGKSIHTHLIYKLEFPKDDDQHKHEPQESLNIKKEGSFIIQVKNPDQQHGRGVQNKRKAVFPAHLQAKFGRKRFYPADPSDLLNHEGCEFLLIAASDNVEEDLGLELETEEQEEADPSCSDLLETFGEVASPTLLKGTWD